MHLVLDSNIIRSSDYGSSNLYQFLERLVSLRGYKIHMPDVVIDEVTAQVQDDLKKSIETENTSARRWGRILDRSLESSLDGVDPTEGASLLRSKLEAYHSVLPYPDIQHRELIKRAIHRRKPFDAKGSGYRDSLIWESVVTLAAKVDGQVVLVSDDGDFSDGGGHLASELQADLVERGLGKTKVVLVPSIQQFVDTYIRPQLKGILESDPIEVLSKVFNMDPEEGIALWVQDEWSGEDWTGDELGLPWEYETLLLSMVENVSNLECLTASEVSSNEYLLRLRADLSCEFDAFVPKAYAYGLEGFSVNDFDWNRHYSEGSTQLQLSCELDFNVKFSEGKPPQISLLSVELVQDQ